MKPLIALSVAAAVVHYASICVQIVELVGKLNEANCLNSTDLRQLSALLKTLSSVKALHYAREDIEAWRNIASNPADRVLVALALTAEKQCKAIRASLEDFQSSTLGIPEEVHDNDEPNISEKERTDLQAHIDAQVADASNVLIAAWEGENLSSKVKGLLQCRSELNSVLLPVLNNALQLEQTSQHPENQEASSRLDPQGTDIREILTINQSVRSGLESIAAVLTKANGESVTFSSDYGTDLELRAPVNGNVIKYNTASSNSIATSPVGTANVGMQIGSKKFGDVTVSGSGPAHLGDTNLGGPITIEKLVVLPGKLDGVAPLSGPSQPVVSRYGPSMKPVTRIDLPQINISGGEMPAQEVDAIQIQAPSSVVRKIGTALQFREEGYRIADVREAHCKTFHWIFTSTTDSGEHHFAQWLESGRGCFWINGKAGSGKSTLMKYIHQSSEFELRLRSWSGRRKLVIAPHFFWRLGTILQRSYEGILRSLLLQIIRENSTLVQTLFPKSYIHLLGSAESQPPPFAIQELRQAIDILARKMPMDLALFILIDGVDEYCGDYFQFCKFLMRLSSCPGIKVLVSSRPIPACCHVFGQAPSLKLQDLTVNDIKEYIDEELISDKLLQDINILRPGLIERVRGDLINKASGVFLWVYLVVKDLLNGLSNFDDPDTLLDKIDRLPSDLEALYDYMFGSMSREYQYEASILLQVTKRAIEIQGSEYTALQASFADPAFGRSQYESLPVAPYLTTLKMQEEIRVRVVEGRLRSRCCGLIEVHHRRGESPIEPIVTYLHRTVSEYLDAYDICEKLKKLHACSLNEIDTILLRSCVQCARFRLQLSSFLCNTDLAQLFNDCFLYSESLSSSASEDYLEQLQSADMIFLQHCRQSSPLGQAFEVYNDFFMNMIECSKRDRIFLERSCINSQNSSTINYLVLLLVLHPFPAFFRSKIQAATNDERVKLVHHLLIFIRSKPVSYPLQWQKNALILFELVNPNLIDNTESWHLDFQRLLPPRLRTVCLNTPWHHWVLLREDMQQRLKDHEYWSITLHMLRAGAVVKSCNSFVNTHLQELLISAKKSETSNSGPADDTAEILQNIIRIMRRTQFPVRPCTPPPPTGWWPMAVLQPVKWLFW